jgi:protein-tyrosine kinase
MSKYFDQTVKVRGGVAPVVEAPTPELPKADPPAGRAPMPPEKLAKAETQAGEAFGSLELPLSNILKNKFSGSDSLEPVMESYRVLRTRLLRLRSSRELRSVVITSAVQGEGKTLTSLNLAMCCAQLHDMRVLLIDADIRSCGLTRLIGSPAVPGLAEVLAGTSSPEKAILSTDVPNLYVLASGKPEMPPAELLASGRFQELLNWCNEKFRLVMLDSPPILNLPDMEMITAACDGALMVVRAQKTPRDVLQRSASQIDPKKLLGVVYNAAEGAHHYYTYSHKHKAEESA